MNTETNGLGAARLLVLVAAPVILVLSMTLASCGRFDLIHPCCGPTTPLTAMYIDTTQSVHNSNERATLLRNAKVVIEKVAQEHGRLIIDRIDSNVLAHSTVLADVAFTTANAQGNAVVAHEEIAKAQAQAWAAVTRVVNAPAPPGPTDIFGALMAAEQRLNSFPRADRHRIVFLSDMLSTVPGLNVTARTWSPAAINQLVDDLRRQGLLPHLPGVQVWAAGAGLSAGDRLPAEQITRIERLWRTVIADTGASLTFYGPDLFDPSGPVVGGN